MTESIKEDTTAMEKALKPWPLAELASHCKEGLEARIVCQESSFSTEESQYFGLRIIQRTVAIKVLVLAWCGPTYLASQTAAHCLERSEMFRSSRTSNLELGLLEQALERDQTWTKMDKQYRTRAKGWKKTEGLDKKQAAIWRGRKSISDKERSGRPVEAPSEENIASVEKMVLQNRRVSIAEIMRQAKLSYGTVERILADHLGMAKVTAHWVPKTLSLFEKELRVEYSKEILRLFQESEENFLLRIVTADELWIHHYDPESLEQSRTWKHKESPRAGKVLASVFWDTEGILLIDYLKENTTMTGRFISALGGTSMYMKLLDGFQWNKNGLRWLTRCDPKFQMPLPKNLEHLLPHDNSLETDTESY
ncbi:hypothetical protein M514_04289 [Trichuris suis]|uniref:Transposase n=1 Tax=Trichuris suis TaxID=68888 RepID=A0A085NQI1_9BILA|nr:hypothetical protein M514_04289 [Trichuris suis]